VSSVYDSQVVTISPYHLSAALALLISFCPYAQAKGVAAIKAHETHTDSSARIFVFEKVRDTGAVIIFDIKGRKPYSVIRSPKVDYLVIVDNLSSDITDDKGISAYRRSLKESKAFISKYSKSKAMVEPYIELLSETIGKYDSGLLRQDGQWIKKEDYLRKKAEEEAAYKQGEVELIKSKIALLEDKVVGCEVDIEAIRKEIDIKRVQRLYLKSQQWLQKDSELQNSEVSAEELRMKNVEIDELIAREHLKIVELEGLKKDLGRQLVRLEKQTEKPGASQ